MTARAAGLAGLAAAAHLVPSVLTVPAVHRRLLPRLSGRSAAPHVALTFDDGPDPASTPLFLEQLDRLQVRATFFLLGEQLERAPEVGRRLVEQGHEVAVHAWRHRPHLLRPPWDVLADVRHTTAAVRRTCEMAPAFWRPPNGIVTGTGLLAARRCGLTPVLWTADGQDWDARATADSIVQRVAGRLAAGGVVLLHDSDITSATGSWRATLAALPALVDHCRDRGWAVGPLREHFGAASRGAQA